MCQNVGVIPLQYLQSPPFGVTNRRRLVVINCLEMMVELHIQPSKFHGNVRPFLVQEGEKIYNNVLGVCLVRSCPIIHPIWQNSWPITNHLQQISAKSRSVVVYMSQLLILPVLAPSTPVQMQLVLQVCHWWERLGLNRWIHWHHLSLDSCWAKNAYTIYVWYIYVHLP